MKIYTIGFTRKSAEEFFGILKKNDIDLLIDIRLNNVSQLAGFTKSDDLKFFLKTLNGCDYVHEVTLAPTKDILDSYKKKIISWGQYEKQYKILMEKRGTYKRISDKYKDYQSICLLCSEPEPSHCHRRLLAEMIAAEFDISITHL